MGAVGVLGGTFDPIHLGHLITAQSVSDLRNLDKIIFVPCNISPHKEETPSTSAEHRIQMMKIAIESYDKFELSEYEIKKGDVSYTYDTLVEFSKTYNKLELIIGYDNLIDFDKWHKPDEILSYADLVVMRRGVDVKIQTIHKFYEAAVFIETPVVAISSSDIRERIKNNLNIGNLVPPEVKEYIYKFELYINN